jgi:hypothetical protein
MQVASPWLTNRLAGLWSPTGRGTLGRGVGSLYMYLLTIHRPPDHEIYLQWLASKPSFSCLSCPKQGTVTQNGTKMELILDTLF